MLETSAQLLLELKQVTNSEVYKLKYNADYQTDKFLSEMEENVSVINGEMTRASVEKVCQAFNHSVLDPQLRLNPITAANCIVTDLGSGTGVTMLRMKLLMHPKHCYGIEVVEQRAHDSQHMYESLLQKLKPDERHVMSGCTFLHSSFNDAEVRHVLLQTTHFFSFDARFTDDTLQRIAAWLHTNRSWKLLISFQPLQRWRKWGLTEIEECCLDTKRDYKVILAHGGDQFSFHLYRRANARLSVGS